MTKLQYVIPILTGTAWLCSAIPAFPQMQVNGGTVIVPASSIERPEDAGIRAHTNVQIFIPRGGGSISPQATPGGFFETPASLACVYKLVKATTGCNPTVATANPVGGVGAIAIVDA